MPADVNRDPKRRSKPFSPAELSPFAGQRRWTGQKLRMRDVKDMVMGGSKLEPR